MTWRKPTAAESSGDWRQKSRTRFLAVKGDFDGDGKADIAELLVNPSKKQFALFVNLASTDKWQLLGEPEDVKWLDGMGIRLVKPGRYKTACGKGYGEEFCAHGEPNFLKLSTPAINMFKEESADVIFYWNRSKKKFVNIQMSD
jgi:hypothetical protein